MAEASSPPKAAETEPTPSTTTSTVTIAKASEEKEKGKTSIPKEKKKGGKEDKQKQSKEQREVVAILSDEESDSELVIDGQDENPQGNAGTGPTAQTTSANESVAPLEINAQLEEKIEQQEQEAEIEDEAEVSIPTPEVLATAVFTTPTPTFDHTYSTTVTIPTPAPIAPTVSSSVPTQIPIYSTLSTTSPIPSTILPICDAITNIIRCTLGQGPHPAMITQQEALVQSRKRVQSPISSPIVSPPPNFNVHLDLADMEFLRLKVEECKGRQGKTLVEEGKVNPYTKIIALLEQLSVTA